MSIVNMQPMDPILLARTNEPQPDNPVELFFWYVDSINLRRSCRYKPNFYRHLIEELGKLTESLYIDWLRKENPNKDLDEYLLWVEPYLNFRFFFSPQMREVKITRPISAKQRKRFLDIVFEELFIELPKEKLVLAMMECAVREFTDFLSDLELRRLN